MAAMLRARILATPANKPLALLPSSRTSALADQGSNDAKQRLLSRWNRCWRCACQVRYFDSPEDHERLKRYPLL